MFPLTSGATGELKQTKVTASTSACLAPRCYRSHPQHYPSANRHATPAPKRASTKQFQPAMRDLQFSSSATPPPCSHKQGPTDHYSNTKAHIMHIPSPPALQTACSHTSPAWSHLQWTSVQCKLLAHVRTTPLPYSQVVLASCI